MDPARGAVDVEGWPRCLSGILRGTRRNPFAAKESGEFVDQHQTVRGDFTPYVIRRGRLRAAMARRFRIW